MGSEFSRFRATSLTVSIIDPAVIWSSREICDMLPSVSPSILYHHILPLSILRKKFWKCTLKFVVPRIWWKEIVCIPLLTWPTKVSNLFGVGRGAQTYKNWTINGGENFGWCCKKWQEHSFVSGNAHEVRRNTVYLYQKLMCYFSIPFYLPYEYVTYYASIYHVPKLCTASSGKIAYFPNESLI